MRTILVSAYACEPLKGSEQGVGWNWVLQMAKNNNLHVITRANNQVFIEEHLPKELENNIVFHYYDTHNLIKGLKNKAKGLYFYYFFWQLGITSVVGDLNKEIHFDYSMHISMGSMWMPTFLHLFKIPFIWGPIGGGDNEPKSFSKVLPLKQRLLHYFRRFLNFTVPINPSILLKSYKAVAILCRTQNTAKLFPSNFQSKIKVILETGIESEIFNYQATKKGTEEKEIKLITTGRLMPSKNILILIKALKLIDDSKKVKLTIIGSGPEKNNILNETKSLSENHTVELIKEIPRKILLNKLQDSDIYLFPSLREGGSWALMEAMAVGLPVICLNWSGMQIITDTESAIQLPVTNPEQMVIDVSEAINKLITDSDLRNNMGNAGRERIKNFFNWDVKGEFMEKLMNDLEN
jgi:glycosyltransferase involved in cell wall biosynthesis